MNTVNININSAAYRADQRPRKIVYRCDVCDERPAIWHVSRADGARITTATVCNECKARWEGGQIMKTYLCLNAWYGRSENPVEIIKETPKRYLVRILRDNTLVPGGRRLHTGAELFVPKYAIKFENTTTQEEAHDA